jgi:hypothetical protein
LAKKEKVGKKKERRTALPPLPDGRRERRGKEPKRKAVFDRAIDGTWAVPV